ncbi:hypothetical protein K466DRAFT_581820 [Polyporus arcularius HHB13444]|uniref:Uncharacterized protein n=1 Tax=Polyporus arcularius HHB13444 TaxID=1314778 RepID=A0A5C3PUX8_9APHY|nr:hypothetical protein K466DRAFT_581820 [Polyporus arcularius HHB13444]
MALGQSTRSDATVSISPTTSGSSSAPTPSSTQEDGPPGSSALTPSSSSLPFSFLVTFIAIFLFFLGCGLGSRRMTRAFRRRFGYPGDEGGRGRVALVARERPVIWDVCPVEGKGAGRAWAQFRPLCASYVRTVPAGASASAFSSPSDAFQPAHAGRPAEPAYPPSVLHWVPGGMGAVGFTFARAGLRTVPRPAPAPVPSRAPPTLRPVYPIRARPPPRPPRWHGHQILGWIVRQLSGPAYAGLGRGEGDEHHQEMLEKQPVQALQVLTVITMPSPERAANQGTRAKAREAGVSPATEQERGRAPERAAEVGEYVLGVARLPWDGEEFDVARR